MWDQWKKRITDLFFTEVIEEEEIERKPREHSFHDQELHTKVVHKYPNRKSFRFPVIPDDPKTNEAIERPAFERKRREPKKPAEPQKTENKIEKKTTDNKPFRPTEVPSPIYGYQKRKKEKEVEEIPTFVRKQQTEEAAAAAFDLPVIQETKETKETNEQRRVGDNEAVKNQSVLQENKETVGHPAVTDEKEAEKYTKVQQNRSKHTVDEHTENEKPEQQEVETSAEINGVHVKELPKKRNPVASPNSNNQRKERKRKIEEQANNKSNHTVPFNVMMSANDKRRHRERKQRMNTLHPIAPNLKSDIPYYLLADPEPKNSQDQLWVTNQQELLEQTLKYFHVKARVVNATQGPSVTRFEVHPEMGVKVSKVKNLSDDLKLNMAAKDIRIEAPIPGKNTIGIEIPNPKPQMVGLQEIFATEAFKNSTSPLTIALGLTIEGAPLITNIKKMPHGLIAGATGSGKSVCINTILISLLYKASHEDVKFLLIDPKMVELAPFNNIPHLVAPVITDVKAATQALKWAVNEMEERYEKFVHEGVRDIERYNQKMKKQNRIDEKMPFLVIVIDELADLMMVSPQDVEDAICRIAQKARACGIHLLLATQRPSVDVITGLIKANIPTRIAFSVSSQVDSRTIIDTSGAEKLLGKGDMLFVENGAGKSVRLQGAFVSDDEIERVTKYARTIAPANYLFEQDELLEQIDVENEEDNLLEQAVAFVVEQHSASTSLLQRHFKIGYNRAARLMDTMERKGIIAQQNGSKPREVLISNSQL
ncbi:DNA translocase FtsK [Virgibacillus dakarensis]|uniref:DNA translocase FtsK n=1 Tax=Virgibacillus dakarensis TaxID=1917889 RepID=UPI000B4413A6|nr:DNA translocase FtsK [Virgibacillus dakarensis]